MNTNNKIVIYEIENVFAIAVDTNNFDIANYLKAVAQTFVGINNETKNEVDYFQELCEMLNIKLYKYNL